MTPIGDRPEAGDTVVRHVSPIVLWIVVTVLWTGAMALAVLEHQPRILGHLAADSGVLLLFLVLPPALFAVIVSACWMLPTRRTD